MRTVLVPTFDEWDKYKFIEFVKNKPDHRDLNKITKHLPGIPQGACGRTPLRDLLSDGRKSVPSFYDARQNTRRLKGNFVILKP